MTTLMRTEEQMMDLILRTAEADEDIRAVVLNGSRADPAVPADIFQDYDIQYFVRDMKKFTQNRAWVDVFGPRIIMQTPEDSALFPPSLGGRFTYLMQFQDGNRIDLTLAPVEECAKWCLADKLSVVLLDKDGICPALPAPSNEDYRVKKPDAACYWDCCNEFWWVSTYVAKGLWREELTYAAYHIDQCVRAMLFQMLDWQVGIEHNYAVSTGKCHKNLDRYLPASYWRSCLSTYACDTVEHCWDALFTLQALFHEAAFFVAESLGFPYPAEMEQKVTQHLEYVRSLPADASELYPG